MNNSAPRNGLKWDFLADQIAQSFRGAPSRPVIVSSWRRCREAGSMPEPPEPLLTRIEPANLALRLRKSSRLIEVASPWMAAHSRSLAAMRHVLYLTDADGIVLHSVGDNLWRALQGLMPGFDWSEATMGTNGAGTALANDSPVAVIGPEHYLKQFSGCTCMAAPVHAPGRVRVGAVDLSTSLEDARPEHLQGIIDLASRIEAALA